MEALGPGPACVALAVFGGVPGVVGALTGVAASMWYPEVGAGRGALIGVLSGCAVVALDSLLIAVDLRAGVLLVHVGSGIPPLLVFGATCLLGAVLTAAGVWWVAGFRRG